MVDKIPLLGVAGVVNASDITGMRLFGAVSLGGDIFRRKIGFAGSRVKSGNRESLSKEIEAIDTSHRALHIYEMVISSCQPTPSFCRNTTLSSHPSLCTFLPSTSHRSQVPHLPQIMPECALAFVLAHPFVRERGFPSNRMTRGRFASRLRDRR